MFYSGPTESPWRERQRGGSTPLATGTERREVPHARERLRRRGERLPAMRGTRIDVGDTLQLTDAGSYLARERGIEMGREVAAARRNPRGPDVEVGFK